MAANITAWSASDARGPLPALRCCRFRSGSDVSRRSPRGFRRLARSLSASRCSRSGRLCTLLLGKARCLLSGRSRSRGRRRLLPIVFGSHSRPFLARASSASGGMRAIDGSPGSPRSPARTTTEISRTPSESSCASSGPLQFCDRARMRGSCRPACASSRASPRVRTRLFPGSGSRALSRRRSAARWQGRPRRLFAPSLRSSGRRYP